MGCDWVAIRNLAITVGILAGFATSSSIFALEWERWAPDGPWKPIVSKISWSAAATWALSAMVFLLVMMSTLSSFCSCASRISACAAACASLTVALRLLLAGLIALFALCTAAAFDLELGPENVVFLAAWGAAFVACISGVGAMAIFADAIIRCQG